MSVPTVFTSGPSEKTDTLASGAKVNRLHWLFCLLILAVNICLFQRSLNGYFLADDFLHVDYLHRVLAGNYGALLQNFVSNWMQAEGTTFYRPLISITLATDYLVGSLFGKPFAPWVYHLTNLGFHTASALLMYFVTGKVVEKFLDIARGARSSSLFAFYAALIFSVYPLHCEVINWVIARVDSVSLAFSLLAFWLFLLGEEATFSKGKWHLGASLAFVLALMSKEMSVIMPPLATAYLLLTLPGSLKDKVFSAIKKTAYLWGIFIFYLVFRVFALGTVSGGYQGSIGEGLSKSLFKRWTDGSLWRLLFPLNEDVFGARHSLKKLLKTTYLLALVNLPLMTLSGRALPGRLLGLGKLSIFTFLWFILSLAPTYQVWNLTENLQGGRFAYFATVPLALMLAIFTGAPLFFLDNRSAARSLARSFSLVLSTLLIFTFVRITGPNNLVWVQAQKELKQFRKSLEDAVLAEGNKGKNIALLNIPQSNKGAHMLYNAATMSVMLSATLSKEDIGKHLMTYEPATFGDAELIKVGRVREVLKDGQTKFYRWDRAGQKLLPLSLKPDAANRASSIVLYKETGCALSENSLLVSPPLSENPLSFDRLVIMLSDKAKSDCGITLSIYGEENDPPYVVTTPLKKDSQSLTIELSERKGYLALRRITGIALNTTATAQAIGLDTVVLEKLTDVPTITVDGKELVLDNDGIARKRGAKPAFNYDVSNIPGAHRALLQLSAPNSWFEHYSGTYRDSLKQELPSGSSAAPQNNILSTTLSQVKGARIPLTVSGLAPAAKGFYELRVSALDAEGKPIGYFSEPICFQL